MAVAYETSLVPASVTFAEAGEVETVSGFNAGSGSDRILFVFVQWRERGNTISGITYGGAALTSAGSKVTDPTAFVSGQLWYRVGPASGSNDIVITIGASSGGDSIGYVSALVVNGAGGVSGYQSGNGNGSSANIVSSLSSAVTSAVGDRVVTFHATYNESANVAATPTNYTERQDAADGFGNSVEFGDADGAASVSPSATWDNSAFEIKWVAVGINATATGGGGGPTGTMGFITNNMRPNAFAPGLAR